MSVISGVCGGHRQLASEGVDPGLAASEAPGECWAVGQIMYRRRRQRRLRLASHCQLAQQDSY